MASKKSPGPGHSSARSLRIEPTSMSVPTEKAAEAINGTMKINKKPITNTGEEVRPYKRSRLLGGFDDLITLKVGQEKKVFTVHKRILCDSSPFFESACKPEWMTSDERIIELPEDDCVAIDHMLYWMYFDQVSIPNRYILSNQGFDSGMDSASGLIAKMYVLGQKYQMPRLRNNIVDACYEWMNDPNTMPTVVLNYVWDNTPPKSPLRVLFLGRIVECYPHDMLTQAADKLVPELLKELMIQFSMERECHAESGCKDISIGYSMHEDYCYRYHAHEQGEMRRCPAYLDDPDMLIIWVNSDN